MQIEILTLNDIIDKHRDGSFPDFLNIDVEGLEYEILVNTDFSNSKPLVICVEAVSGDDQDHSDRLIELLRLKGYMPYAKTLGNVVFLSNEAHRQLWSGPANGRLRPQSPALVSADGAAPAVIR